MLGKTALACGDEATAWFRFRATPGDDPAVGVTLAG
jgi:hypothetical protein